MLVKLLNLQVILVLQFLQNAFCISKVGMYNSDKSPPIVIDGSDCPFGLVLDSSFVFTCVCVTGLWAFYNDACGNPSIILGAVEEKCVFINQTVAKVHLLSSPETQSQTVSVFMDGKKKLVGRLEVDVKGNSMNIPSGGRTEFIVSSGTNNWGLNSIKKCFGKKPVANVQEYCKYGFNEIGAQANLTGQTCNSAADKDKIPPEACTPYIVSHSKECATILKQQEAVVPFPPVSPNKPTTQGGRAFTGQKEQKEEEKNTKKGNATKSSPVPAPQPSPPPGAQEIISNKEAIVPQGRTFMRAKATSESNATSSNEPQGNATESKFSEYHEDRNLTVNMTFPEINSQIWNYMTSKALEILNLSTPKIQTPPTATFKFLDLSKQIMQKACPDHYVKDSHFDLALQTFMNLQKKNFNFNDAFSDYAAKQRIEDSLYLCLQNITEYPFIDPLKRTAGNCNETVELGVFEKFGQQINLNVSWGSSGREREPLIETVWKIFTHAHTACYRYFEEVGFNDHHRFTSVMLPVFTNEINDIWKSMTELTQETYSGLLGNPIRLMDAVTYCSEFAKLDTGYPWEIPRPEKELNSRRRKRSISGGGMCLRESFDNECDTSSKPKISGTTIQETTTTSETLDDDVTDDVTDSTAPTDEPIAE